MKLQLCRTVIAVIIICLTVVSCKTGVPMKTFKNPILAVDRKAGADPAILYHKGTYYFYATNGENWVYTSTDMVNWTRGPKVLPKDLKGVWAPEVYYHPEDGKFYMYYTKRYKIGIAVSDRPDAMFKDLGIIAVNGIDAHPFRDDDGRLYLYFTNTPTFTMYCVPMKSPSETGGPITKCFAISQEWEKRHFPINEGPWMIKRNGIYYMLYSGANGQSIYYAIGYATAPTAIGPVTKYDKNPVFQGLPDIYCTAHGSVERDRKGQLWHLYHQKPDTKVGWIRDICLDPVRFDENGVFGGTPTRGTEQVVPFMESNLVWSPDFCPRGAIFNDEVTVKLSSRTDGVEIRYTLDGSEPGESSTLYKISFKLKKTSTLKALAFKKGMKTSTVSSEHFKQTNAKLAENPSPDAVPGDPGFDVFV